MPKLIRGHWLKLNVNPVSDEIKFTTLLTDIGNEFEEPTLIEMLKEDAKFELRRFIRNKAKEYIYNPQKRKDIIENVKSGYKDYIKPLFSEDRYSQIIDNTEADSNSQQVSVQNNTTNSENSKIIVSEEQAEIFIEATLSKAKELSAMLTMLSMIYIKNDKTENEYKVEQEYLKQLTSDEMTKTMELIVERKDLVDNETITQFTDFLKGYIRHDNELIPINRISNDCNYKER